MRAFRFMLVTALATFSFAAHAQSGDSMAQGRHLEAEGKFRDAVRGYRTAARKGNCPAAKRLGEIYDRGVPGVNRDLAESTQWYEMARQCGELVPSPTISRRDREEMEAEAKKTAEAPTKTATVDPLVQGRLLEAQGKFPDAVRLYRRAARAGNGPAARRLGEIYEYGVPGIGRDLAESLQWYELAGQRGESVPPAKAR